MRAPDTDQAGDTTDRGGIVLTKLMTYDDFLLMIIPIVVYWVYSGIYEVLGSSEKYRLHSRRDEETKNLASKRDVVKGVLFQQALQATITVVVTKVLSLLSSFLFFLAK
ncbi:hypothetical protein BHE74_00014258 [Ensete ventricosum]|nr:hypothetical protein GW17_00031684 [Ensete ventricosum]RWW77576.1 hypothetical protein BHE74_00014258 [Ensete ventricosum]